jgi:NADH-quinone oxidoreductase subunit E
VAVLSDELRARAGRIVARYPERRSALLPLLYLVQAEQGQVTDEGMREVAGMLGLTTAEVEAVATYYTMFKKHPTGRWVLSICTNLSCALAGGRSLYDRAVDTLGPESREVTAEGAITLEEVECLGACDAAPVVQVNYANYDRVTEDRLAEIIEALLRDDPPQPSRGQKPVDHVATARLLAGQGSAEGDG